MRFRRRASADETEDPYELFQQLVQKDASEIRGSPFEQVWHMNQLRTLLRTGEQAQAREKIEAILQQYPTAAGVRLFVSLCLVQLGALTDAIAQLGIGLALEPDNFAIYAHLARLLRRAGAREAAERILENGWQHAEKLYPRRQRAEEKARYFSHGEPTRA